MVEVFEEFSSTQELVSKLLASDERCRRDDKWLCYRVVRHFTRAFIPFEDFDKFPSFETVTRVRRKLQNDKGLYLPDSKTVEKRREREEKVRNWSVLK